jgi:O-antigen ligase
MGMFSWTARAVADSPIVGIGIENYIPWARRQPGGSLIHNSLHSGFLHILATQGLLGFVPFMALVVSAWLDYGAAQRLARARRNRGDPAMRELGSYALFLQIALLGAIIGAITHPTSSNKGWWMLMGISAVTVTLARQRSRELDAQLETSAEHRPPIAFGYEPGMAPASR